MRGTPRLARLAIRNNGIIPAYAGNTVTWYAASVPAPDHPRVCGEHSCITGESASSGGSSPRMRGTRVGRPPLVQWDGIIPAYAGNTGSGSCSGRGSWDHPRVCGEHPKSTEGSTPVVGSSPRMRGTHVVEQDFKRVAGIIPAYAGNTSSTARRPPARRDHPRVCGEHVKLDSGILTSTGSSPRMRGTLRQVGCHQRQRGIIPAYAGNTG